MVNLVGKVIQTKAEVITIFRVDGKYYPATDKNREFFEAYLHTDDEVYLSLLTNEVEI